MYCYTFRQQSFLANHDTNLITRLKTASCGPERDLLVSLMELPRSKASHDRNP